MKIIMVFMEIFAFIASLFGCEQKPDILDGPGMVYVDSDHRSIYANALELDWDIIEGYPMFAVAYLGNGDDVLDKRDEYIKKAFASLSDEELEFVQHFDFGGNEWYLIVPRYDSTEVINTDTEETTSLNMGEAFTVRCNGNVIVENYTHGGYKYTPSIDENGNLVATEDIVDITAYIMSNNN